MRPAHAHTFARVIKTSRTGQTLMHTLSIARESPWKTYSKAMLFLAPPVLAWTFTAIFVAPKVKQMWADAGGSHTIVFSSMDTLRENWLLLCGTVLIGVVLSELFWKRWADFRKTILSVAVFLINTGAIASITLLLVTAIEVGLELGKRVHF